VPTNKIFRPVAKRFRARPSHKYYAFHVPFFVTHFDRNRNLWVHAANVYPESTLGVHRKKQISAAAKVGLQTAS
jgi:hypothetical protein